MNQKTEEKKYEQLRKLGQELHVPIPEHSLELEVTLDGKVIQHLKQRSHSWVRNAYNLILTQISGKNIDDAAFGAGLLSIKDTGAAVRDGNFGAAITKGDFNNETAGATCGYTALAAIATYGILIGSDAGAWDFNQYVLLGPITEGVVSPNQINHMLMAAPIKSYAALTWTITWVRYYNNNGAGNVTVNEVALCANSSVGNVLSKWITSRDVLGAPVIIPPTGQLKVTYNIQLAYPA